VAFKQLGVGKEGKSGINNEDKRMKKTLITGITGQDGSYLVEFLLKKGYGVHGAYWHNNFGTPMSHGCVNLAIPDAEKLFYWTSPPMGRENKVAHASRAYPGTKIVIHD